MPKNGRRCIQGNWGGKKGPKKPKKDFSAEERSALPFSEQLRPKKKKDHWRGGPGEEKAGVLSSEVKRRSYGTMLRSGPSRIGQKGKAGERMTFGCTFVAGTTRNANQGKCALEIDVKRELKKARGKLT